jgi:hypothetical protein
MVHRLVVREGEGAFDVVRSSGGRGMATVEMPLLKSAAKYIE